MEALALRRRDVLALVGGVSCSLWPLAARTQQTERPRRIGVLLAFAENDPFTQAIATAFEQALGRAGWVQGKNIRVDYRFAAGDPALFKTRAAELVGMTPDVILASTPAAIAAVRERTHTIPIVFVLVIDPIGQGFVESLARPGGNVTGLGSFDPPLMAKWLQLLKDIAPAITRVAVVFNPDISPFAALFYRAIEAAAPSVGIRVTLAPVYDNTGIEEAVAAQAAEPGGSLIGLPDSFVVTHRDTIIAEAARHTLPLIGPNEAFPRSGALMCYSLDVVELHAQAASYVDHILKGARAADLPVQQPTKYLMVINMKTAKALGLTVPQSLLARADEVIE
jgi:putative ABC transport system substrate-binding protein